MKKIIAQSSAIHTIILIVFLVCFLVNGCSKMDKQEISGSVNMVEERFFNSRTSSDLLVQSITKFMRRNNDKYHFVEKTVKQIGYPYWDKAITVSTPSGENIGNSNSASITYIPFVRDSQNFVNAALLVKITPVDTLFKYLCDWQYATLDTTLGFGSRNVFHVFAKLDQYVFGRTKFRITDESLLTAQELAYMNGLGLVFDSARVIYSLDSIQNMSGRNNLWMLTTWCDNVYTCIQQQMAGFKTANSQIVPGCPSGTWLVTEICTDTWVYIPSGGDGGGTGTGGSPTSGGSGGSGPGTPPDPPCGPVIVNRNNITTNCDPGWVPVEDPTISEQLIAWDNSIIIDPSVRPCVLSVINNVRDIRDGVIAEMIYIMSQQIPAFNWEIREVAQLPSPYSNADAVTSINSLNSYATTQLNQSMLVNATNISLARTVIHEAVHAFIYNYINNQAQLTQAQKDQILALPFAKKLKEFYRLFYPGKTNEFHNSMALNFHNDIRDALKILCTNIGISLSGTDLDVFCSDMAWGGLQNSDPDSPWMDPNILTDEDRARITKRLDVELNNLPGFSGYVNGYFINLTRVGTKSCP